eukprot:1176703-Prorocentrum_minimum.AAC.4
MRTTSATPSRAVRRVRDAKLARQTQAYFAALTEDREAAAVLVLPPPQHPPACVRQAQAADVYRVVDGALRSSFLLVLRSACNHALLLRSGLLAPETCVARALRAPLERVAFRLCLPFCDWCPLW